MVVAACAVKRIIDTAKHILNEGEFPRLIQSNIFKIGIGRWRLAIVNSYIRLTGNRGQFQLK